LYAAPEWAPYHRASQDGYLYEDAANKEEQEYELAAGGKAAGGEAIYDAARPGQHGRESMISVDDPSQSATYALAVPGMEREEAIYDVAAAATKGVRRLKRRTGEETTSEDATYDLVAHRESTAEPIYEAARGSLMADDDLYPTAKAGAEDLYALAPSEGGDAGGEDQYALAPGQHAAPAVGRTAGVYQLAATTRGKDGAGSSSSGDLYQLAGESVDDPTYDLCALPPPNGNKKRKPVPSRLRPVTDETAKTEALYNLARLDRQQSEPTYSLVKTSAAGGGEDYELAGRLPRTAGEDPIYESIRARQGARLAAPAARASISLGADYALAIEGIDDDDDGNGGDAYANCNPHSEYIDLSDGTGSQAGSALSRRSSVVHV
jgi:hypothetical protein